MYTGYFSKLKKYTDTGLIPVAISRMQPTFYKGASYTKLAPSWNILSAFKHPELVDEEELHEFYKKLCNGDFYNPIPEITEYKEATLPGIRRQFPEF